MTVLLRAAGLTKRYGRVAVVDNCDFELREGEVMAVVGDNGSGKSTMIKMLSGVLKPDSGSVQLAGVERVSSRRAVPIKEIETVFQTLALSPALSVLDNLFMGREILTQQPMGRALGILDRQTMRKVARHHLDDLGLATIKDLGQPVETLSGGQRQSIAIARASLQGGRIIILDEPTAALGVRESQRVLALIKRLRESGVAVLLISHNMQHVFEVADRIHVHRLGQRVALKEKAATSIDAIVSLINGEASA